MSQDVIVYKGRTTIVGVSLGADVSGDTFTSQIRKDVSRTSALIAAWSVSFVTNGVDGELLLTLDNSLTSAIVDKTGYMDLMRTSGGEPLPVFDKPLPVLFRETITV